MAGSPTVILLPPFGGSPAVYAELVRLLGSGHPVLGIQSHGLRPDCTPDATVPEMVDRYLRDLRGLPDAGAISSALLVGYSMGGVLAVELARRLIAGRSLPLRLLLVDSAPTHEELVGAYPFFTLLTDVLRLDLDLSVLDAMSVQERLELIRDTAAEQGRLGRRFPLHRLQRMADVCAVNQEAAASFVPGFWAGPLHSVLVGTVDGAAQPPDRWSDFADEVTTHYLPGTHFDVLAEPSVREVAAAAVRLLGELEAGERA